jgi:hypothetical protein
LRTLRELFHATVATKPQRPQRFFTTVPVLVSKIIRCRYNFPEIKSPELTVMMLVFDPELSERYHSNEFFP